MCSGDTDVVSCPDPNLGLIILSAKFASVVKNYFFCPNISGEDQSEEGFQSDEQPGQGFFRSKTSQLMEKCEQSSVTTKVENVCLGQSICKLQANPQILGAAHCDKLRVFLKVTFACVHQKSIVSSNEYKNPASQIQIMKTEDKKILETKKNKKSPILLEKYGKHQINLKRENFDIN